MIYPSSFENKIGFDRIRQMITENCLCRLGRNYVDELSMQTKEESLEHELRLTDELRQILTFEDNFPQDNYLDVTPSLRKLESVGSYLEIAELFEMQKSISTIKRLQRYFNDDKIKEKYAGLTQEFSQLKVFPFIGELIDRVLTKEGSVKDNASPELKQIRIHIKQKQSSVYKKIQSILNTARKDGLVDSEADVTIRDGRPVIPVLSGFKRKLGGLVHDESASGKTVFIEPTAIVELNNEIRELEYAERREILKILSDISTEIRPYSDELMEVYEQLGRIDFIRAKAKLAQKINGVKPIISKEKSMEWRKAIHPLLFLTLKAEGKAVVPLDIKMEANEERILLISGPNAGGKSVCLKTVGLLQYMFQSGLLVPMSENSEICLFEHIFIDIGDEQSLENDLSTYSSHLLNMKHCIKASNSRTLVLIDEFGTGTEPALGGAIAEAILEGLNTKEVFGVITTHYGNLKHFASETPGIVNGAMLFDTQKIQPLYRLSIGEPGSSFAIEIARNIGLPENILQSATDKVGSDYVNFEKHLREIIRDKKYWEEKRQKIRKVEKTLDSLYLNYSNELDDIQKERKKILKEAKAEAEALVKEANKSIERTIREIKENKADKEKTKEAREKLEDDKRQLIAENIVGDKYQKKIVEIEKAGKKLVEKSQELKSAQVVKKEKKEALPMELKPGVYVKMKDIDTIGEVLEVSSKSVLVAFGSMRTTVHPDKLIITNQKGKVKISAPAVSDKNVSRRKLNFKSEIDVRGKRADEALVIVQDFIDDAVMVSSKQLKILHGKGNGILRQLIQDYLKTLPVVKSAKDAHIEHGGTGITLVNLDI